MLLLLPILVFLAGWLFFWAVDAEGAGSLTGWGGAFLRAAVVWGALVVLFGEGLSLLRALSAGPLAILWGLAFTVLLVLLVRNRSLQRLWALRASLAAPRPSPAESLILVGLAAEAVILLAIAWVSPPNNTDSLQYHMPRVVHWAQERAIVHYVTAYEPQLTLAPWSETAVLNLRLLWGNDQPANLVQLFCMVGSWIGVGAVAHRLGAGRRSRLLSMAFVASLPIGVLEATSTQNDLVAAFWLVALSYFIVTEHRGESSPGDLPLAGASLGLALLTKATFLTYVPFLGLWMLALRVRKVGWGRGVRDAALLVSLAALFNLGYWVRNVRTYGMPLGSPEEIRSHTYSQVTPAGAVASWVENLSLNLATPSEALNARLIEAIRGLRGPDGESQFGLLWAWNNENLAGNPLHLAIIALSAVGLGVIQFRKPDAGSRAAIVYGAVLIASLLLFFSLLDFDVYGVRYQVPFFVGWAPIVGAVAERAGRPRATSVAALILMLVGAPWVLFNGSRPAIGLKPRTMIDGVFDEAPRVILMANWTHLRDGYFGAAETVSASGCSNVGLRIDSHDLEYAYWWLLDAPQSGIRIENIDPPAHLERYLDPEFRPCAIICMVCGERTRLHGLELAFSSGEISVFVGDRFDPADN